MIFTLVLSYYYLINVILLYISSSVQAPTWCPGFPLPSTTVPCPPCCCLMFMQSLRWTSGGVLEALASFTDSPSGTELSEAHRVSTGFLLGALPLGVNHDLFAFTLRSCPSAAVFVIVRPPYPASSSLTCTCVSAMPIAVAGHVVCTAAKKLGPGHPSISVRASRRRSRRTASSTRSGWKAWPRLLLV